MKLSCCSLRRISRNRKIVLRTRPGGDGAEEDDAQENLDPFAPVEDDPAESNGNRYARQADA